MNTLLSFAPLLTLIILIFLFYFLIKKGLGVFLVSTGIIAIIAGAAIRQQRWGLTKQWELEALNNWTIVGMILGGVLAVLGFSLLYNKSSPRPNQRPLEEVETLQERRECPYCAELILKKAKVCKHCGKEVTPLV